MERKISFANLQEVVKSAYELNKSEKGGTIDPRVASEAKAGSFGISVVLTDGRSVDKGDADALFALGKIARIPLAVVLKTQQAAAAKDGQGAHCGCGCDKGGACSCAGHEKKEKLPLGRCGIRAISAIVPQGDPEGKYGVISNMLVALANSEPAFSDKLYKLYQEEVASMDIVNAYKNSELKLADDVARNFANPEWPAYPLTADKYMDWIAALPEQEQVVNLWFSMDVFGSFLPANTGIFMFMKALPQFAAERGIRFATPSEVTAQLKPVGMMSVPYPISDIDEARDVSAWKGNDLQNEALNKLYAVAERVSLCSDRQLKQDWEYLQSSDHFYYMSTKNMADGASHAAFSPYDSPFSAFTNYMNVLADFLVRVEEQYPESIDNEELNSLLLTIRNQASEIASLNKEVKSLRAAQDSEDLPVEQVVPVEKADVEAPAKKPGRKPAAKKATEKKPAAKKAPAKKAAKKAEK